MLLTYVVLRANTNFTEINNYLIDKNNCSYLISLLYFFIFALSNEY